MYDVFISIIQTSMGKHYVRKHESTMITQQVWREYTNYMRTSTKGEMVVQDLLSDLTTLRLSPTYRGSTTDFVTAWFNKLKQYETLTPIASHFPDTIKKTMLQNALCDFPAFAIVKTTEQVEIAKGSGPISYPQFVTLVIGVASAYDIKATPQTRSSNRLVNLHVVDDETIYEFEEYISDDTTRLDDGDHHFEVHESRSSQGYRRRPSLRK